MDLTGLIIIHQAIICIPEYQTLMVQERLTRKLLTQSVLGIDIANKKNLPKKPKKTGFANQILQLTDYIT